VPVKDILIIVFFNDFVIVVLVELVHALLLIRINNVFLAEQI